MNARKGFAAVLAACLLMAACALGACSDDGKAASPSGGRQDALVGARDQAAPDAESAATQTQGQAQSQAAFPPLQTTPMPAGSKYSYAESEIDIDLTRMSSTAVYSAVYMLMVHPEDYQDQVLRMKGTYWSQMDEATGTPHCFVIVQDATACCAQGIEFVWDDGEHVYPDDYPEEGAEVVACGHYGSYPERSSLYAYMRRASLELA